ncbi:uncharacterized protein LY89DRAFT_78011 [Mollisia scopiformis]|uniref:Uncharacterized protein n=1 Tax=Mollisia scopiformis TaxID=149040 RepID=A0A194X7Z9_MOLSC|nr:uncharacterized protein LY89DRAFT_78011 [Mollisia scopiformis]KUJ16239.1 hypothetical protein LY89DRAFT_78011 [Mollisia scopiformis]
MTILSPKDDEQFILHLISPSHTSRYPKTNMTPPNKDPPHKRTYFCTLAIISLDSAGSKHTSTPLPPHQNPIALGATARCFIQLSALSISAAAGEDGLRDQGVCLDHMLKQSDAVAIVCDTGDGLGWKFAREVYFYIVESVNFGGTGEELVVFLVGRDGGGDPFADPEEDGFEGVEKEVGRAEGEEFAREVGVRFLECGGDGNEVVEEIVRVIVGIKGEREGDEGDEEEKVDVEEISGRRWWRKIITGCGRGE